MPARTVLALRRAKRWGFALKVRAKRQPFMNSPVFEQPILDLPHACQGRQEEASGGRLQGKVNGVNVFRPRTGLGEVRRDGIACWFIDTSRPFARLKSGRIAVKVINHLGDEVMKVFRLN
ncbi:hypothetical protein [Sphaerotilus sp.]|uniref:hypothetical protein n=1 Tax=Sphaerotilus sp. TaxID=2093942 RepID=UPI00286E4100|nr:hypothetical protein [Sphaerotilus sp.]